MAGQGLFDDDHRETRGSHILLGAGKDDPVLAHIHGTGEDIRGHVAHQGHIPGLGHILPLGAVDGIVGAVVEVAGFGVQLQLVLLGNIGVVFVPAVRGEANLAVLFGLLTGDAGEVSGDGVVRLSRPSHEVQGHHGELARGPALQKQHLVVVGHAEQPDEIGLGIVEDLLEYFGAVAHLHDGHTAALVVGDLAPRPLQHLQGQHGRTGRKVVDPLSSHGDILLLIR